MDSDQTIQTIQTIHEDARDLIVVCTMGEWRNATESLPDDGVLVINPATSVLVAITNELYQQILANGKDALASVMRTMLFGEK